MEITKKPNIPQQTASISNKNQTDVTSWIKNNSFTNSKKNMIKLVVLALFAFLLPFSVVVSSATYSKYDFFKKDQVTEGDVLGADEAVCQEDEVCGMVGLEGCVARDECLENEFACGEGADMVCCDKGECQECSPCVDGFQAEPNECGEITKSCESVDCTGGVCGEVESVCYPVKYKVTYSTKEGKCPDPEGVCPGTANKAPECSSNTATVQEYTLISGTCEGFDTKTGVCNEVVEDLEVGVVWEPMVLPKGSPLMGAKGGGQLGVLPAPHISSVSPTSYSFVGGVNNFVIENGLGNRIRVEVAYSKKLSNIVIEESTVDDNRINVYAENKKASFKELYGIFLHDLRRKEIRSDYKYVFDGYTTVYGSEENLEKIRGNRINWRNVIPVD